ncbi:hypothetical protein GCM10022254_09100 [Actinomadura meridiana]|uniref:Uncharacterized protein n=1 Tax=Actinomadura meridiana TaxID=559626 RepID=A0ABP8BU84_9ACTN
MTESTADRLTIASEQLTVTGERLSKVGLTTADLRAVARYLIDLSEHGYRICSMTSGVVERGASELPTQIRIDLDADLGHAEALFSAITHFAYEIQGSADALAEGDTTP